jgi:hypothetical protein
MCSNQHNVAIREAERVNNNIANLEARNFDIDKNFRLIKIGRTAFENFTGNNRLCKNGFQRIMTRYNYIIAKTN